MTKREHSEDELKKKMAAFEAKLAEYGTVIDGFKKTIVSCSFYILFFFPWIQQLEFIYSYSINLFKFKLV